MDLTGLGQLFNIERPSVDSSKDFIGNAVRLDAVIGLIAHDDRAVRPTSLSNRKGFGVQVSTPGLSVRRTARKEF